MGKNTGLVPQGEEKETDLISYTGIIPDCIPAPSDCTISKTQLTYLIYLLLVRYCEQGNVIDTDLSTIDISCLITANPDVVVPDDITIGTLSTFYKNHICSLYATIADLQSAVNNVTGLICTNDIVETNENESITIDVLFNDYTTSGTGTIVITIDTAPDNGIIIVDGNNDLFYTPPSGWTGNESVIYRVTKGAKHCTAKVIIKVLPVTTDAQITDIVQTKIIEILSSNDYWDLGFAVGESIIISKASLMANFTLTGGSPGLGNPGTRYTRWAVSNGFNGTRDYSGSTLRGYKSTDSDYYYGVGGGNDTVSLAIGNIPPHRHEVGFYGVDNGSLRTNWAADYTVDTGGNTDITEVIGAQAGAGADLSYAIQENSGDGTDNINDQGELKPSPDAVVIRNKYETIVIIQKIA